jgi:hypothetical protein
MVILAFAWLRIFFVARLEISFEICKKTLSCLMNSFHLFQISLKLFLDRSKIVGRQLQLFKEKDH